MNLSSLFRIHRARLALLSLVLAPLAAVACGGRPTPVVGEASAGPERVLVFVPGITGSTLRDPVTGRVVWGRGRNLIGPKDGGYDLALPIDPASEAGIGARLEVDGVLEIIRLLGLKRPIYRPLISLFTTHGYTLGDLDSPRPTDDLFFFAYDSRQDNIASARALARGGPPGV